MNDKVRIFDNKQIRMEWNEQEQDWYLSIVDVIELLTGTDNPRRYWSDLKRKMRSEGSQLYENIVQLKMESSDGKLYKTDVANTKEILRITRCGFCRVFCNICAIFCRDSCKIHTKLLHHAFLYDNLTARDLLCSAL